MLWLSEGFTKIESYLESTAPGVRDLCRNYVAMVVYCAAQAQKSSGPEMAEKSLPDPKIAAALQQVSAARIQTNIEKLVSFGTRSTLSAQDPASLSAGRGIGAAREWIKAEFERYSKDCGGLLGRENQQFMEQTPRPSTQRARNTKCYVVRKGSAAE